MKIKESLLNLSYISWAGKVGLVWKLLFQILSSFMKGESYRMRVKVTVAGCDVHQCTIDSIVDKHLRDLVDEIEPEDLEHECHAAIVVYERDSRSMMKLIQFLKKYENGRSLKYS